MPLCRASYTVRCGGGIQKRERLKPFASPLCAKTALQLRDERGIGFPHEDWFTLGLSFANAITKNGMDCLKMFPFYPKNSEASLKNTAALA